METLMIWFMSTVSSLQSLLERKAWLKMLPNRNNFTVYTEVFPQGQACREAEDWQFLVCHKIRYATITRTTSCATSALSVLL